MFYLKGLLAVAWLCCLVLVAGAVCAEPPAMTLFGSREIKSTNMASFSKWTDMWRKYNLPRTVADRPRDETLRCRGMDRVNCNRDDWEAFIVAAAGKPERQLLDEVNAYMNRSPYIVDPVNWGVPDYWATPDEFFLKDGDCEDYAISKYVTLKRLGVDPETMRLVILQDENLRAAHAVLAVALGDDVYILDNQVDSVLSHTQILHYRPVYSINESAWWLHQVKRFSQ